MKKRVLSTLLLVSLVYVASYIWLCLSCVEVWDRDGQAYELSPGTSLTIVDSIAVLQWFAVACALNVGAILVIAR